MKIYTKTGDKGSTSLVGGKRIAKNSPRLNAYGTVDELNSHLGLLRSKLTNSEEKQIILNIQNTLFNLGAYLATDEKHLQLVEKLKITEQDIENLENLIDKMDSQLEKIKKFIVYGEDELSAICHIARAVSRRAEREILTVNQEVNIEFNCIAYINRLSDFLFTFARYLTKMNNSKDFFWKK